MSITSKFPKSQLKIALSFDPKELLRPNAWRSSDRPPRSRNSRVWRRGRPVNAQRREVPWNGPYDCHPPGWDSVGGGSAISLAGDVGDAFRSHLCGVLKIRWYLAMIAGPERLRPAVSGHRDLAAQNHDPHVEVVRMHILGEAGLLAAMNDLKA